MTGHSLYSKTFREKQIARGLVQLSLWVPAEQFEAIKALIRQHLSETVPSKTFHPPVSKEEFRRAVAEDLEDYKNQRGIHAKTERKG